MWFAIAILYGIGEGNTIVMILPLVIITIIFLLSCWKLRSDVRRLEAIRSGVAEPPRDIAAAAAQQSSAVMESEIADRNLQVLFSLPPPRTVRMRKRSKIGFGIVFVLFGALAIFFLVLTLNFGQGGSNPVTPSFVATMFVLVAFAILIPILIVGSTFKQKRLMVGGQLVLARITRQWSMRNTNGIAYVFTDASGNLIQCRGNDPTRACFEGMTVPVYYDPANPRKQIAACASAYEVVLPGQP
ncbi:MAG: hypothetical protein ACLP1Y_03335 [Candidatus Acidiferrales bacterium]